MSSSAPARSPSTKLAWRHRLALAGVVLSLLLAPAAPMTPEVAALTLAAPLPVGSSPMGIAIDPLSGRIYVTNSGADTLSVIDPATNTVIATVPTGAAPNQVVLNPATGRLYVSNFDGGTLTVIDAASNTVVRTLPVGGLGLALDVPAQRLYATAGTGLSVIDAATDTVTASVPAPRGANLWGVAVDAATHRLYVTDISLPRVLVFDQSGALLAEVAIDAPGRFGMALDTTRGLLYVASYVPSGAHVSLIDLRTNRVLAAIPVGGLPFGLALDGRTNLLHASNLADGTLTSIDLLTRRAVATLTTGREPAGVAISPLTGSLYVVNFGDATLGTKP